MDSFLDKILSDLVASRIPVENEFGMKEANTSFDYFIARMAKTLGINVSIKYCRTFSKYTVVLNDRAKKEQTILYDEYLTETFNNLNLLYAQNINSDDYTKHFLKLLIERLLPEKKHSACISFIKKYFSIKYAFDKISDFSEDINASSRSFATIQRVFILFHEIAHCLAKNGLVENLEYENVSFKIKSVMEKENSFIKRESKVSYIYDHLAEDKRFVEECYCDEFAFNCCLNVFHNTDNYTIYKILNACALVFHHIKTLAYAEFFATFSLNEKNNFEHLLANTICKGDLRKIYAFYIFPIDAYDKYNPSIGNDDELMKLHESVNQVNRYDKRISINVSANEIFSITSASNLMPENKDNEDELVDFIREFVNDVAI